MTPILIIDNEALVCYLHSCHYMSGIDFVLSQSPCEHTVLILVTLLDIYGESLLQFVMNYQNRVIFRN